MPSTSNRALIAAAGSGKTEQVVAEALGATGSVLVLTYTNENHRHILSRLREAEGTVPSNIRVRTWFDFLVNEGARPYQIAMELEPGALGTLNFLGRRNRSMSKASLAYYLDEDNDLYRDGVADFVCSCNKRSGGRVVSRLEAIYSKILIDEFQDLVGYDLDLIDLLLAAAIPVTLVGDPRQRTFVTNLNPRNKQYQGAGIMNWLDERKTVCATEVLSESFRCCQELCDFSDSLYPDLPKTTGRNVDNDEHRGIRIIEAGEVAEYVAKWQPMILRDSKATNTAGLPAMNIGVAKGLTFERVLIFPTAPMMKYLDERDLSGLKPQSIARLYVAVTRARHSVTFVRK
ncbi:MAG: UvrD-helicase domain-containing protein [Actinomycetota bacterium]